MGGNYHYSKLFFFKKNFLQTAEFFFYTSCRLHSGKKQKYSSNKCEVSDRVILVSGNQITTSSLKQQTQDKAEIDYLCTGDYPEDSDSIRRERTRIFFDFFDAPLRSNNMLDALFFFEEGDVNNFRIPDPFVPSLYFIRNSSNTLIEFQ